MSKFYEIDAQSKFITHKVSDRATHIHNGNDKARLIYSEADERLCIGGLADWKVVATPYDVIDQNTKVLFGSFPLPTGWNLDTAWNDNAVLLTNETGEVGNTGGSWTITGMYYGGEHNHSVGRGTTKIAIDYGWGNQAYYKHSHTIYTDGSHVHSHDGSWRPYSVRYCVAEYQ